MSSASDGIDFEAEGLLEGLNDEARSGRLRLLQALATAGYQLDELRGAVATNRLVLLSAEHVLTDEPRYTFAEIAGKSEVPLDYLVAFMRAAGLAPADVDERVCGERDLQAVGVLAGFRRAGLDADAMLEVARVLGRGLVQTADAMGELFYETFLKAGVSGENLALQKARAAGELLPRATPVIEYLLRLHMRITEEQCQRFVELYTAALDATVKRLMLRAAQFRCASTVAA